MYTYVYIRAIAMGAFGSAIAAPVLAMGALTYSLDLVYEIKEDRRS